MPTTPAVYRLTLSDLCTRDAIVGTVKRAREAGERVDVLVLPDDVYALIAQTSPEPGLLNEWMSTLTKFGVRLVCAQSAHERAPEIAAPITEGDIGDVLWQRLTAAY